MSRGDLNEIEWRQLAPLLPRATTGRPRHDDRRVIDGISWVLRTGAPWRDLPERYGRWASVASRFHRWRKAGLWQRVLSALQAVAGAAAPGRLGLALRRRHGRAGAPARGRSKRGQRDEALGRSRGGFSTKVHVRAEGGGKPMAFALTGGERPEVEALPALLDAGAIKRAVPAGRGCGPSAWRAIVAIAAVPPAGISGVGASAPSSRSRATSVPAR